MEKVTCKNQPETKTYVLLTVDTEADIHQGRIIPLEQMVYCRVNGVEYGINRMMDIAERYDATMTFFVSVFEHRRLGMEPVKKVCKDIHQRGHDVQLHTHPNWIYEHRFMWGYPLEKQIELIREGKEVIYESIGKYPIAHRAGGFGANEETLIALTENGIKVDSTFLYGRYSRLNHSKFQPNNVSKFHGVLEIPVTVFNQFKIGNIQPKRPFDINANSFSELIFVLNSARKLGIPFVNLLMHSFSFVYFGKDRQNLRPNNHDLKKFEKLLHYINVQDGFEVIGIEEYYQKICSDKNLHCNSEIVLNSGVIRTCLRACRYPLRGRANFFIAMILGLIVIVVLSLIVLIVI
jgi:peptidoglycan/xylan/chitin deacetylase (PgdA/CDA1 family)